MPGSQPTVQKFRPVEALPVAITFSWQFRDEAGSTPEKAASHVLQVYRAAATDARRGGSVGFVPFALHHKTLEGESKTF